MILSTSVQLAKTYLEKGGVIGLPTETVYGLAGNIWDQEAINKIFTIKERPKNHPLIAHVAHWEQVESIASDIPVKAQLLAERFWPGPLTMILSAKPTIPSEAIAGLGTIAVRMPEHPLALKLLSTIPFPLVAPSANPFGKISPTSAMHVFSYFKGKIPLTLDGGNCKVGLESTIIGFKDDAVVIYRQGIISKDDILEVLPNTAVYYDIDNQSNYPGSHRSHYAPKTPLIITESFEETVKKYVDKKIGLLTMGTSGVDFSSSAEVRNLSKTEDLKEAASNLYAQLHELDNLNLDVIVVKLFPTTNLGIALNDKLFRASSQFDQNA
ncbi:L-threonylcarbamoyladenylate synthase [Flectobacillus roseus]|uniref:Threonylcarbamoyl-AMP synthase n=1 Tax=Flectobacillus roseus TaxID=502259 RepID=A0ABT6YDF8_9BACT|nr:L-threonylcarbamoyladenylate synthase [Flectobacillus roseus]MDI9861620.1 L-threonylcarbamoyladenylate synthase [Flectobacillus roseus]